MKIAIVSPLATVAPHFETELELAQRHLDQGDEVELLSCHGRLACCDFNASRAVDQCHSCRGRRRAGVAMLDAPVAMRELIDDTDDLSSSTLSDQIQSIEQLVELRLENFDLGYAVLSSLISLVRDPRPDLQQHRLLVQRLYRAAVSTYRGTIRYLHRYRPNRVYVFNGRFAAARAVLRACQAVDVECCIHERGCDTQHFQIYQNRLPHDIDYFQQRMAETWAAAPDPAERDQVAQAWYVDRVNRVERSWHSFVKGQTRGQLPDDWSPSRRNVGIFTSSEDEFASIGDCWRPPIYPNQLDGIRQIVRDLPKCDPLLKLYIRIHPNLGNANGGELDALLALRSPNVCVIPPDAACDSYQLMQACEKVVTFGSSIGIEAVFWNRPSILLGMCFYRDFSCVYQPKTHTDAIRMIDCDLAPAVDKTKALMYGFWFQTHGTRFKYFEAEGLFHGRFKGAVVHAPPPKPPLLKRWVRKISKRFKRRAA